MCTEAGFKTKAAHFFDIDRDLTDYDAIIFCIDSSFLQNQGNPITNPFIKNITSFAQTPGKLLVLAFPGLRAQEQFTESHLAFIQKLGLNDIATSTDAKSYFSLDIIKNINYSTSLEGTNKIPGAPGTDANIYVRTNERGGIEAGLLPLLPEFDPIKKISFPIGMYIKNNEHNNYIMLTRCPVLLFNEISENFWINPVDPKLRSQLMDMEEQALYELNLLSSGAKLDELKISPVRPDMTAAPDQISKANKIAAGWLAPDGFDGKEILQKQVDYIAQANLNLLWFSLSPELYLSVNATQPEKKELNLNRIRNITAALKKKFAELGRPVPPIYLGIEITGNLRVAKVKEPMVDMYGTVYDKIPAPFDINNFWKPELLDVFDQFADIWEQDVGNGLPISGLFFDFEMYHAQPQQPSSFIGISDFSPTSIGLYEKTDLSPKDFAIKLFEQRQLDNYFNTLKHNAYQLGRKIRNHIKARVPRAQMAAYFPNISSEWFYIGLLGGLSTPQEPLILATFNNDFKSHQGWLVKNKIYCRHLAAMLLSKFQNQNSFRLIDEFNKEHDGIWYNRFSWLAHPYDPTAWWATESTPLNHDLVARKIGQAQE